MSPKASSGFRHVDILAAITSARRDPSSIVEAATMSPNIPSKGEPT